jgi:N-acetylneuraminic acid mutarotase
MGYGSHEFQNLRFTSGRWDTVAPLLEPRTNLALCAEGGRLYAAGGEDGEHRALSSVEMYDSEANTWTQVASLRQARRSFALTTLKSGHLLAVRGRRRPKRGP